ncbi:MAG: hypothetical protein M1816_006081 [Peltula sp. TS41687]|nr:MAG: hypothetical protein M1816_006081 [Peltula sp. TS41687]
MHIGSQLQYTGKAGNSKERADIRSRVSIAGITNCFVNLGSDHPSLLEAMVKGQREKKGQFPRIITCPNEVLSDVLSLPRYGPKLIPEKQMVALSMADGYARLTNKPQCVIVHVDVGTQGLGAAIHNASCGRVPVLIFAGLSPYTIEGEMRGSRTEYIHWIQDVPDQKAILAQYCRYVGEIKTGKNIKQLVNRALQFATSDPKGPVYLVGAREVMEEELEPYQLDQGHWSPVQPSALQVTDAMRIADALVEADEPLAITGYIGRNHNAVAMLVSLALIVPGLRVLDTAGSDMSFPASHSASLGVRFGVDESIRTADVILAIDCDVPWIDTQCHPKAGAKIFHIDLDPLKSQMPVFYLAAAGRYRADAYTALGNIIYHLSQPHLRSKLKESKFENRYQALVAAHTQRLQTIAELAKPGEDGTFGTAFLTASIRRAVPEDTIFAIEAVTNTTIVADQLQASIPGSWLNCGGGGLGWSGGAALGIKLATEEMGEKKFVCQIVGDGTFLFSVPSSVYWISHRYKLPVLTVVLNNQGWNAPRRSALLVHPDGYTFTATNDELNISITPSPDYAGIAKAAAAGNLWAERVETVDELERLLPLAVESVKNGVGAVIDARIHGP